MWSVLLFLVPCCSVEIFHYVQEKIQTLPLPLSRVIVSHTCFSWPDAFCHFVNNSRQMGTTYKMKDLWSTFMTSQVLYLLCNTAKWGDVRVRVCLRAQVNFSSERVNTGHVTSDTLKICFPPELFFVVSKQLKDFHSASEVLNVHLPSTRPSHWFCRVFVFSCKVPFCYMMPDIL